MRKPVISAAAAALALGLTLTACGARDEGSGGGGDGGALIVGATAVPAGEVLSYIKKDLAAKNGLDLEIKEFTDYVLPNTALQEGSLDANLYQNEPFLDDFNKSKGTDLVPVVDAYLPPMGVYSKKVQAVADLPDGVTVAVPSDITNEGRALKLLASEGVITLKEGAGTTASPGDIVKNPKNLKFKELEPAQLPRSLDDVAAAVINNNYAQDAGLSPADDAILLESAKNNPYANLLAVKKGNEDDPRVEKLAELLTSDEVRKFIQDKYKGSVLPVTSG
ncbi:metal ABC transporter substrate-binding protein [Streptomyces dioscori]|uniref:Lipoprotein n=1 Tax=Streptomyces dioscori TaxID=2109333 RepID=A0A2P8Q0T0_9ACTN|nr:MetQ/NlpA family ABC transporter substrate-binding protein [Streptomyces dioscori]PSM39862.1 metal ABC transporter substrate-binding protein [Streptomyces dioscori]